MNQPHLTVTLRLIKTLAANDNSDESRNQGRTGVRVPFNYGSIHNLTRDLTALKS
jgi:hypothetical protein